MKSRVVRDCALFIFLFASVTVPAFATEYFDDFSHSQTNWVPEQDGWSFISPETNTHFYRCNCLTNSTTWRINMPIGSNWLFQADMYFRVLYGNTNTTGVGTLGLSKSNGTFSSKLAVNITDDSSGNVLIQGEYNDGTFHTVIDSGWLAGGAPAYHVWIARPASNYFQVIVLATNGFYFNTNSPPVPVSLPGLLPFPVFA